MGTPLAPHHVYKAQQKTKVTFLKTCLGCRIVGRNKTLTARRKKLAILYRND